MTTDINIINVNGLDYPIKDQEARDVAESAVKIFAYYEDGLVASQAYATVGTPICWKGELYYTTTTVAKGNVWAVGVNLRVGDKAGVVIGKINDADSRISAVESELTANGNRIYMDYKNGKYGYNTSPNRGADTFRPFNNLDEFGIGGAVVGGGSKTSESATFKLPEGTYEAVGMYKRFSSAYGGGCSVVADGVTRINMNASMYDDSNNGPHVQIATFTINHEFSCSISASGGSNTGMVSACCGIRRIS